MTIKEYIIDGAKVSLKNRRDRLAELGAPAIMITSINEELERLANNELRCSGDKALLEEEYVSVEQKKGRGGIPYFVFNENINYFPHAKYGRFVAKGEVK